MYSDVFLVRPRSLGDPYPRPTPLRAQVASPASPLVPSPQGGFHVLLLCPQGSRSCSPLPITGPWSMWTASMNFRKQLEVDAGGEKACGRGGDSGTGDRGSGPRERPASSIPAAAGVAWAQAPLFRSTRVDVAHCNDWPWELMART